MSTDSSRWRGGKASGALRRLVGDFLGALHYLRGIIEAYIAGSPSVDDETENLGRISVAGMVRHRDHASASIGQSRRDESPFRSMTKRVDKANSSLDMRPFASLSVSIPFVGYKTCSIPRRLRSILWRLWRRMPSSS